MQDQVAELAEKGKALSPGDRARLVDMLLESLNEAPRAEIEASWDEEVERRLVAYEQGNIIAIEGNLVLAKARELANR